MRIVVISDTHGFHHQLQLPEGDMLIHCGDITLKGELDVMQDFANWLKDLPYAHKLVIFGNHEIGLDKGSVGDHFGKREQAIKMIKDAGAVYLENSGITIEGIKFYGCPNVSNLPRWAFDDSSDYGCWNRIPDDVEVLISHSPPVDMLDEIWHYGSSSLRTRVNDLMNKKLRYNVFGHCHADGGKQVRLYNDDGREVMFVNAAICDVMYNATNPPMMIEI